ncbi:MAG: hypothetical protein Q4C70_08850 [Planctomycetia bacterium]|nr:hypothetical protein [Planctomycetia bacterium]
MSHGLQRIWSDESGVLTFEWILLITVVVIGIVGGLSAVRDAYIDELGDTADAMTSLDHTYWINPPLQASIDDPLHDIPDDYISGSANGYVTGVSEGGSQTWVYTPSHYKDVKGNVTRFRVTGEFDADGNWVVTGTEAIGQKPNQTVDAKSSVTAEGSTVPNFTP